MPVLKKLSLGVLKKLFGTQGQSVDPDEEKAELIDAGVPWTGVTADEYWAAYKADNYSSYGTSTSALNALKSKVNNSVAWMTVQTTGKEFSWNDDGDTRKITLSGWKIEQRESDIPRWPDNAYLGLLTKMPDKDGNGYEEPAEGANYLRINLHKAIISGGSCITYAAADEVNGGTYIENDEIFVFVEVEGSSWGTIIGIGVFSSPKPRGGDKPQTWARLTTPITTQPGKVPLFRLGEFRTTLR